MYYETQVVFTEEIDTKNNVKYNVNPNGTKTIIPVIKQFLNLAAKDNFFILIFFILKTCYFIANILIKSSISFKYNVALYIYY